MDKPKPLSPQQFAAVSALPGPERYSHFVKQVADTQEVWGLRDQEGWVAVADSDGAEGIPFWPHPAYAEACSSAEWAGNEPASIEVHDFVETWLPGLAADGIAVAVFPTPTLQGVFVSPAQLQDDINDELSLYE